MDYILEHACTDTKLQRFSLKSEAGVSRFAGFAGKNRKIRSGKLFFCEIQNNYPQSCSDFNISEPWWWREDYQCVNMSV